MRTLRFLALALIWGASFTFIKVSLDGLAPAQLVLTRLVLGATVLLIVTRIRRVSLPRTLPVWGQLAVAAVLSNVAPFMMLSYGERSTDAGLAGVLVGATPLLTLALASATLPDERATRRTIIGLAVGFVGVVVVLGPWRGGAGSLGGELACLGAALSYAAGFVYVRRFLSPRRLAPSALAATQLIAAVAIQALVTPLFPWRTPTLTFPVVAAAATLGLVGTGLAYVLYFRIVGEVGATSAASVNYVVPVFAVLIGVVLLGEPLTWGLASGGLVIVLGVTYANARPTTACRSASG